MAGSVPATEVKKDYSKMTRADFPPDFVFGIGTSAYQVEGAAAKGGRGVSIWDDFTMGAPNKIADKSNGNVAVDMYHRYKEDIRMMKNLGFDAYRFSISWPRLIPSGKISLGVNREAVDYYNDLIDTVCKNGMKPFVTLFHWDLPDLLEKSYGGFLSPNIVADYVDYVDLCFREFGDRVKHWATFNEPWSYCYIAYLARRFPPGVEVYYDAPTVPPPRDDPRPCLHDYRMNLDDDAPTAPEEEKAENATARKRVARKAKPGTPQIEGENAKPFKAAKNMIVAHAEAVVLYKTKFKAQGGQIGIVLNSQCFVPLDDTNQDDKDAARRVHDFKFGWFLEPILTGKYPETMRELIGRTPDAKFDEDEAALLKKKENKIDFLGLNYYSARYVEHKSDPDARYGAHDKAQQAKLHKDKKGKLIGVQRHPDWLVEVPEGLKKLLQNINDYYNNTTYNCPPIYITENGVAQDNRGLTLVKAIEDKERVDYYRNHLGNLLEVIKEWKPAEDQKKLKIKGYFAWSWVDNFEWDRGYTARFGIMYVDFMNDLKRYPKVSAKWFAKFLGGVVPELLYGVDDKDVAMPPDFELRPSNGKNKCKPVDSTDSESDAKGKGVGMGTAN